MTTSAWHIARKAESERQILDALAAGPMTRIETADTGISRRTVDKYVTLLHAAGQIHIIRWQRQENGHGAHLAVYAVGAGVDAPQPKPKTNAQLSKEKRRRVKADPARRLDYLQRARIRETRRGKSVPVDSFLAQFAGLFGRQQEAA
jgi:hypothetical protein